VTILWWLCKVEEFHQVDKGSEQSYDKTVNRREQQGTSQAAEQSQTSEMIEILLLMPSLKQCESAHTFLLRDQIRESSQVQGAEQQ
jgi:hypothetical protein